MVGAPISACRRVAAVATLRCHLVLIIILCWSFVGRAGVHKDTVDWDDVMVWPTRHNRKPRGWFFFMVGIRASMAIRVIVSLLQYVGRRLKHRRLSGSITVQQREPVRDLVAAVVHLLMNNALSKVCRSTLTNDHIIQDLIPMLQEHSRQRAVARVALDSHHQSVGWNMRVPETASSLRLDQAQVIHRGAEAKDDAHAQGLSPRR